MGTSQQLLLAGGGSYVTAARDFDGSTYYTRGADLTGIADGKAGIVSVWVRIDAGNGTQRRLFDCGAAKLFVDLTSANKFDIRAATSGGAQVFRMTTTPTYSSGATWIHFLSSWDANAGVQQLYVNDAAPALDTNATTNSTIDYANGNFYFGAASGSGSKWNGCVSEMFFHTSYLDLTVTANRRKFVSAAVKPVSLGADGSVPLAVQPLLYLPVGNPADNKGSGGNFSLTTGALTVCSSSP